jgi:hypothetical protein
MRNTLIRLARLATAAGILAWDFGNEDLLGSVKECLPDGPDKSAKLSSGAKARLGLSVEVGAKAPTPKERGTGGSPLLHF